jgi:hypothetical protein
VRFKGSTRRGDPVALKLSAYPALKRGSATWGSLGIVREYWRVCGY